MSSTQCTKVGSSHNRLARKRLHSSEASPSAEAEFATLVVTPVSSWRPPKLSPELQAAKREGRIDVQTYVHGDACVRLVSDGTARVYDMRPHLSGWRWLPQIQAFMCIEFGPDVSLRSLVAVGILQVRTLPSHQLVLSDGFLSLKSDIDDILWKSDARWIGSNWFIPSDDYRLAHEQMQMVLTKRVRTTAEKRARIATKKAEREKMQREDDERERKMFQAFEMRMEAHIERCRAWSPRTDRQDRTYGHKLRQIEEIMQDKPLEFAKWTPAMLKACDDAFQHITFEGDLHPHLRLMRDGGETLVNVEYPPPRTR